jgi:glycosyltransferase involved in cell wall biosynthesis
MPIKTKDKSLEILQVSSTFPPVIGGTETVVFETCRELVKKGHNVTVVTSDLYYKDEEFKAKETVDGIKVLRFRNKRFLGGYGHCPEGLQWIKDNYNDFDLVHLQGYNRYLSEIPIKFLSGKIPTVFTAHGFIHTKKNRIPKLIHDKTIGRQIKNVDMCTMLTPLDKIDLNRLNVPENKTIIIPNGVDVEQYKRVTKQQVESFKKKFKIKPKTLCCVARIHESKGYQYIIQAIKDTDYNLLIVGPDGGYKATLQKQIEYNNMQDRVIFSGRVTDQELKICYSACDMFVLASEWEGFGLVVIEAMASGTPVITSDSGALNYLIKNNKNGYITKFKDTEALKEKIIDLMEDKANQNKFIIEGKVTAEKYSWKTVIEKNLNMYNNLINQHGK